MQRYFLIGLVPMIWGTTYFVTTAFLPENRPFFVGAMRALPAGIAIVLYFRQMPQGTWWWKSILLGMLNIGVFFGMLFVSAYRLPGGIAATLGAIQPLLVAILAWAILRETLHTITVLAGIVGILGVGFLVFSPNTSLDFWGVMAAFVGAVSMALGIVLVKRWQTPVLMLLFTGWQLLFGGIFLLLISFLFEGSPPKLTLVNWGGLIYLTVIGTGLAYFLWFKGIEVLGVSVSFYGLLSPLVATLVGFFMLGESLSKWQFLGMVLVFVSVFMGQRLSWIDNILGFSRRVDEFAVNSPRLGCGQDARFTGG